MNKKEISEIRRLLTKDHCRIDRIFGCCVNGERQTVLEMKEAFLSLPEEDMHKFCGLFRKTLSGTLNKNLMTLSFPPAEEAPDGQQAKLLALRDSGLEDEALLHSFCEDLTASWTDPGSFLILLAFGRYDIPSRTRDNMLLDDASDDVYSFIVCAICPVSLSKAGLVYDAGQNAITSRLQDHMVDMPAAGFLFPAFEDRNTDIHQFLYYSAKPGDLHEAFLRQALGTEPPLTAETQHAAFASIVEETFQRDCDFDVARTVHEQMAELMAQSADAPEPPVLNRGAVKTLLSGCGASEEQLQKFEERFDELSDSGTLAFSNVYSSKKFEVVSPEVKISIAADRTDLIETRVIDGREYLMIPVTGDIEVNGIRIRTKKTS